VTEFEYIDEGANESTRAASPPVKGVSLDNLLNMREAVHERVAQAHRLLREADELGRAAHLGGVREALTYWRDRRTAELLDDSGEDALMQVLDATGWQYLMSESGLRTFMDQEARERWDKQIAERKTPPLTAANIASTFRELHAARGEMFERGVINVFRSLSWHYKTNSPVKFGPRIIINYLMHSYGAGFLTFNHGRGDQLDDLERVLHVLDGKPEPDHRHALCARIRAAHGQHERGVDTDYVSLKWFKKGSAHIKFKRQDLVEQMNRIVAKHYPNALAHCHATSKHA
jgi:hypothetical protein